MAILSLLSICHYTGDRNVCAISDVIVVDSKIVSIPLREFYGWTNLFNVTFPSDSDLISIEDYAFRDCTNLHTINFPSKLQTIGSYTFWACSSLTTIHFPASLQSIGSNTFQGSTGITSITADEDIQLTIISGYAFVRVAITEFAIWKNVITIAGSAFTGCENLERFTNPFNNPHFHTSGGILYAGTMLNIMPVKISGDFIVPKNVTALGTECCRFSPITSMSFEAGSQMQTFGSSCMIFSHIRSFEFPDNNLAKQISLQMFYGCYYLQTITLTKDITSIGQSAFYVSALEFIDVAPDHSVFVSIGGVVYSKDCTQLVAAPPRLAVTNYIISKNVMTIANSAFRTSQIPNIEFEAGSQLNSLGPYAFSNIVQATFSFDQNCPLTSIPAGCFESSQNLYTIDLPRHLQSIEGSAFSSTALTEFIIPSDAQHLVSIDGVLYSHDNKILYRFPPAKADANYEVPSSVEIIGSSAFATCQGISTLAFAKGSKLHSVRYYAFESSTINNVVFSDDSDDVTFDTGCFTSSSVKYVTLPGKMKVIKSNMFKDCFDLVGITLSETATAIETGAFTNCQSLSKLSIPCFCAIQIIPSGAFANTRSLTELELPYLVRTIAANSMPSTLKKLTLWCPLTPSVIEATRTIPTLTDVYILCGLVLQAEFVSSKVEIHHICFTKMPRRFCFSKVHIALLLIS